MKLPLRLAFALVYALSAVFHLLALRWPHLGLPESDAEHLAFVGLNLLGVRLWLQGKPLPMLGFCSFMLLEQLIEHGVLFVLALMARHFDYQSLGAVLFAGSAFGAALGFTRLMHAHVDEHAKRAALLILVEMIGDMHEAVFASYPPEVQRALNDWSEATLGTVIDGGDEPAVSISAGRPPK